MKLGYAALLLGGLVCAPALTTQASSAVVASGNTITYTIQTSQTIRDGLAFIQQGDTAKLYFAGRSIPALPFPIEFSFDATKAAKVDRTLLLGISSFDEATHLVIGTDTSFALGGVGQEFSSVFPGFDENTLISDLVTLKAGPGEGYDAAYADVVAFGTGLSSLASDPAFKPPGAYDLLAFSTGSIIGGGAVRQSVQPAVPEPASWALMLFGVGAAGAAMRRGRAVRTRVTYA